MNKRVILLSYKISELGVRKILGEDTQIVPRPTNDIVRRLTINGRRF